MANFEFYERGGKQYKRFSNVMDYFQHPKLVDWKIRMGKADAGKISRAALKHGSRVDELCGQDWQDGSYKLKKADGAEVQSCMKAWEAWKSDYSEVYKDIQGMQETVFYDDWGCAGTLDIRTSKAILDIKSSKRVSLPYWVQTAFYNREYKLPERWILRLSKEFGVYEFVKCPEEYSQDYLETVFVSALNLFNFYQSEEQF